MSIDSRTIVSKYSACKLKSIYRITFTTKQKLMLISKYNSFKRKSEIGRIDTGSIVTVRQ